MKNELFQFLIGLEVMDGQMCVEPCRVRVSTFVLQDGEFNVVKTERIIPPFNELFGSKDEACCL